MELIAIDADGQRRRIRLRTSGLDLTPTDRRVLRNARLPDGLRWMMQGGALVLFGAFLVGMTAIGTGLEWLESVAATLICVGAAPLIVGSLWALLRLIDYKEADALVRAWLRLGRCPACGHHVAACAPDADGPTRCTECGVRWMISEESASSTAGPRC